MNVSPISPFNSFVVSCNGMAKAYRYGTEKEATKDRAKLIKLFKDEGLKVTQWTLAADSEPQSEDNYAEER